jgi:hypothetical protein
MEQKNTHILLTLEEAQKLMDYLGACRGADVFELMLSLKNAQGVLVREAKNESQTEETQS